MSRSSRSNRGAIPVAIFVQDAERLARAISLLPDLYQEVYTSDNRTAQRGNTRLTLPRLNELTREMASTVQRLASNYSSAITPARDATFLRKYQQTHQGVEIPQREGKVSAVHNPAYYTNAVIVFAQNTLDTTPSTPGNKVSRDSLEDTLAVLRQNGDIVSPDESKGIYLLTRNIVSSLIRLTINVKGLGRTASVEELKEQRIVGPDATEATVSAPQRSTILVDGDLKQLIDTAVRQRNILSQYFPPAERKTARRDISEVEEGSLLAWSDITVLTSMLDVTTGVLTLVGEVRDMVFQTNGEFSDDFLRYAEEKKVNLPPNYNDVSDQALRARVARLANSFRTQTMAQQRDTIVALSTDIQNAIREQRRQAQQEERRQAQQQGRGAVRQQEDEEDEVD